MNARKGQVLIAVGLGLVALLALVGALGAAGDGTDAPAAGALAEGLVGHWKFDEGEGTIAVDASGLGNHGTLIGGPVSTTMAAPLSVDNPYALVFDGVDDYVIVDSVADEVAGGAGAWSASLWVKAPTLASSQDGLLAVNTAEGDNVVLLLLRDHKLCVFDGVLGGYEASSTTAIDDDRWHHLAYTSAGVKDEGSLYVDGREEITHTVDYTFTTEHRWSLGQEYDPDGPSNYYTGLMDEVRVYTRTLSALEVAELASTVTETLMALYNSTDGANWDQNTGWGTDDSHCDWYGVDCDTGTETVTRISLRSNNLSGTIPSELGSLSNLRYLYLGDNALSGAIPPELGSLSSLQDLSLDSNNLSGAIPSELGSLSSLMALYLRSNNLSGAIPPELGSLSSLQDLSLRSNNLSGAIPSELGSLSNLRYLYLYDNALSGAIPAELASLNSLYVFYLNGNPGLICWETKAARDWAIGLDDYLGPDAVCSFLYLPLVLR